MNKVILVMDDPMRCINCPLAKHIHMGGRVCGMGSNAIDIDSKARPDWCPLKEAPEEQLIWYGDDSQDWDKGYNSCLREIIGEEDNE